MTGVVLSFLRLSYCEVINTIWEVPSFAARFSERRSNWLTSHIPDVYRAPLGNLETVTADFKDEVNRIHRLNEMLQRVRPFLIVYSIPRN